MGICNSCANDKLDQLNCDEETKEDVKLASENNVA